MDYEKKKKKKKTCPVFQNPPKRNQLNLVSRRDKKNQFCGLSTVPYCRNCKLFSPVRQRYLL